MHNSNHHATLTFGVLVLSPVVFGFHDNSFLFWGRGGGVGGWVFGCLMVFPCFAKDKKIGNWCKGEILLQFHKEIFLTLIL